MTDEESAAKLARLSPGARAKFEELERLRNLANEEERERRMVHGIVLTIVGRLVEITKSTEDPLIKLCIKALDKDSPEREQFKTIVKRSSV